MNNDGWYADWFVDRNRDALCLVVSRRGPGTKNTVLHSDGSMEEIEELAPYGEPTLVIPRTAAGAVLLAAIEEAQHLGIGLAPTDLLKELREDKAYHRTLIEQVLFADRTTAQSDPHINFDKLTGFERDVIKNPMFPPKS